MPGGAAARIVGSSSLSCLTIVSVEAPPFLITVSSAERRPSWRTMFVCTAKPSRTWATSRTYTTAPLTYFTGRSLRAATASGLLLRLTRYSRGPSFTLPDGRVRFCRFTALLTSAAEIPFDSSACGSRSTMIWRGLPPYGSGSVMPWMGAICWRMR